MQRYVLLALALVAVVMLVGCDSENGGNGVYAYLAKYVPGTNSFSIVRVDGQAEQPVLAASGRFAWTDPTLEWFSLAPWCSGRLYAPCKNGACPSCCPMSGLT